MSRGVNWRETWRTNGAALMLFSLLVRPLIIVPLMCIEIAGEWASKTSNRIPAARAVWMEGISTLSKMERVQRPPPRDWLAWAQGAGIAAMALAVELSSRGGGDGLPSARHP